LVCFFLFFCFLFFVKPYILCVVGLISIYIYICVCVCIHMYTEYFDYKFYIPLLFHVLSCRVPFFLQQQRFAKAVGIGAKGEGFCGSMWSPHAILGQ
jgi:hypothetical protein